jgi:hypothetical protein
MNDAQRKIVDDLLLECAHYDQADRCDALLALLAQSTPPPREPTRDEMSRWIDAAGYVYESNIAIIARLAFAAGWKRDAAPDSAREPEGT